MRHLHAVSFQPFHHRIIHRVRLLERREMSALRNYGEARARNAEDNLLGERWRGSIALFTPA
jgi:hypothetical protein